MNVQIQSVKFDADKRLIEFVNAKMAKLDRFAERRPEPRSFSNSIRTTKRKQIRNHHAAHAGRRPGGMPPAESLEESVDEAIDALKRQLGNSRRNRKINPTNL